MSTWHWDDDGHKKDDDGNFWTREEAEKAVDDGDLVRLSNGCLWNRQTGEEFWPDGTKK